MMTGLLFALSVGTGITRTITTHVTLRFYRSVKALASEARWWIYSFYLNYSKTLPALCILPTKRSDEVSQHTVFTVMKPLMCTFQYVSIAASYECLTEH